MERISTKGYIVEGRDAPNNLDIQHPYLRDFNTKTDGESSSLPLFFHPKPQFLKLPLLRYIGTLFRHLWLRHRTR